MLLLLPVMADNTAFPGVIVGGVPNLWARLMPKYQQRREVYNPYVTCYQWLVVRCVRELRYIPSVDDEAPIPCLHLCRGSPNRLPRTFFKVTLAQGPMQTQLISNIRSEAAIHRRRVILGPLEWKRPSTEQE